MKSQSISLEIDSKNKLGIMAKDCNNYIAQLDHVNECRQKLNEQQSRLLRFYQELEYDDRNLYTKLMEIINKFQNKILESGGIENNLTKKLLKNINIDRDIHNLIESLKSKDKPESTILYQHYPSDINFNSCNDIKDFRVVTEIVKTMKSYSDKVFTDYDETLEENKNRMRELMYKLFDLNKNTEANERNQLLEYTKDERIHELFLITLSKLRTNAKYSRQKDIIELLSKCITNILDITQKTKNYESIKNCIILSETFFYPSGENDKKVYISEYIKNHPLLQSLEFWKDFVIDVLLQELNKIQSLNYENLGHSVNIIKGLNVPSNFKGKIGEVMFSQILPYVNHMLEFQIDKKFITKLIMDITNKYNYLSSSSLQAIYNLIFQNNEELEKIQKEIKDDKNMEKSFVDEYFEKHKKEFEDEN